MFLYKTASTTFDWSHNTDNSNLGLLTFSLTAKVNILGGLIKQQETFLPLMTVDFIECLNPTIDLNLAKPTLLIEDYMIGKDII